jgi:hypothetical protein
MVSWTLIRGLALLTPGYVSSASPGQFLPQIPRPGGGGRTVAPGERSEPEDIGARIFKPWKGGRVRAGAGRVR